MKDRTEAAGTAENVSSLGGRRGEAMERHSERLKSLLRIKRDAIEKDVKHRVKQIVTALAPSSHIFMPVQTGLGSPDLDFIISINGFALRIETKVDHKQPSPRQLLTIAALDKAGVPVLIIDQSNLLDVAVTVDYLLTGKQGVALWFAQGQREEYLERV